jgi:hypothetical protein
MADITVEAGTGATAPCDAISVGFGLVVHPASLGPVLDVDAGPDLCAGVTYPHCR